MADRLQVCLVGLYIELARRKMSRARLDSWHRECVQILDSTAAKSGGLAMGLQSRLERPWCWTTAPCGHVVCAFVFRRNVEVMAFFQSVPVVCTCFVPSEGGWTGACLSATPSN